MGFVGKIISLDNIRQWEERDSVIKESVSQHSFKVASICLYLLQKIERRNTTILSEYNWVRFSHNCLKLALLHDFDESIIGRDISHCVKYNAYNGEEIRQGINSFVKHSLENDDSLKFINHLDEDFNVKSFVKLCDWLALLTFIVRNRKMGVGTFEKEYSYCSNKISQSSAVVRSMLQDEFSFYKDSFDVKLFNEIINECYE